MPLIPVFKDVETQIEAESVKLELSYGVYFENIVSTLQDWKFRPDGTVIIDGNQADIISEMTHYPATVKIVKYFANKDSVFIESMLDLLGLEISRADRRKYFEKKHADAVSKLVIYLGAKDQFRNSDNKLVTVYKNVSEYENFVFQPKMKMIIENEL